MKQGQRADGTDRPLIQDLKNENDKSSQNKSTHNAVVGSNTGLKDDPKSMGTNGGKEGPGKVPSLGNQPIPNERQASNSEANELAKTNPEDVKKSSKAPVLPMDLEKLGTTAGGSKAQPVGMLPDSLTASPPQPANAKGETYTSLPTGPKGSAVEKRENALLNISPEQFVQAKEGSFTSDYRMGKVLGEGRL